MGFEKLFLQLLVRVWGGGSSRRGAIFGRVGYFKVVAFVLVGEEVGTSEGYAVRELSGVGVDVVAVCM